MSEKFIRIRLSQKFFKRTTESKKKEKGKNHKIPREIRNMMFVKRNSKSWTVVNLFYIISEDNIIMGRLCPCLDFPYRLLTSEDRNLPNVRKGLQLRS